MKYVTKQLRVTCNFTDLKRLQNFIEGKDLTLIVKIDGDYAKQLILMLLTKMKDYKTPVFRSKKLNPEDQAVEKTPPAKAQRNDNQ